MAGANGHEHDHLLAGFAGLGNRALIVGPCLGASVVAGWPMSVVCLKVGAAG